MTTRLEATLVALAGQLTELDARWALVGGLAVSVRAEPRFTRDIDVAMSVASDEEAEDVVRGLTTAGYSTELSLEQEATDRLATVRLVPPGETVEGLVIDLLFASSGIEPEIVEAAERLEVLPGVILPVAQVGHLLALKVLSTDDRRPFDAADILALVERCDAAQRRLAEDAVGLITDRGFDRGRDLPSELRRALER